MSGEWLVTEFEINETVRVPGCDGEPEQWKRKADLTVEEFGRYAQGMKDDAGLQMRRAERFATLVEKAAQGRAAKDSLAKEALTDGLADDERRKMRAVDKKVARAERTEAARDRIRSWRAP
jgi:hypothetical protein